MALPLDPQELPNTFVFFLLHHLAFSSLLTVASVVLVCTFFRRFFSSFLWLYQLIKTGST
jgi:hypothetical protein